MDPKQLQTSLSASRSELERAEDALASVLRELAHVSRAKKTLIGSTLQVALDNVRAARRELELIEKLAQPENEPT